MTINEYIKRKDTDRDSGNMKNNLHCKSGLTMSVQASGSHKCEPKLDNADHYRTVEIGLLSRRVEDFDPYTEMIRRKPRIVIYPNVPVSIVDKVIRDNGGIDLSRCVK